MDELLYYKENLISPTDTRPKLLAKSHEFHSHSMMEWENTRSIWYWPGLKNEIDKIIRHAEDA